jgi:hypothetical protein
MFIIVGWRTQDCDEEAGYMFCPNCRARKTAAAGFRKTYLTTFFIPLFPIATHEGYYRCEGCQGMFNPDNRFLYDFGSHPSPKLWDCRHCRSSNPSHIARCQTCGTDA